MNFSALRRLELGGGAVAVDSEGRRALLQLPPGRRRYADAQLDDYGGRRRRRFLWLPGTRLSLRARFQPAPEHFLGTAGFGFWNAPFGDPTAPWPALPRAAWFFYGSTPNDFPVAPDRPGRGWYAGTVDATSFRALALAPLALPTLLLNHLSAFRARVWPRIQARLGFSFAPVPGDWRDWHSYQIRWGSQSCEFYLDGRPLLVTAGAPRRRMGFVCWVDNQYLALTPTGRFRAGVLPTQAAQILEIADLQISAAAARSSL